MISILIKHTYRKASLLVLLLFCISTSLWAYDFEVEGIYYNKLVDGNGDAITDDEGNPTVEITYAGESAPTEGNGSYNSSELTISGTVDYQAVGESEATTYTVTAIGDNAFQYCTSLESITLPTSVTSIGDDAFSGCTTLATVTFESTNNVTSVGASAFASCVALTSLDLSAATTVGESAFSGCTNLVTLDLSGLTEITSADIFSGCSSLTSLNLSGLETLDTSVLSAFSSSLTTLDISGLTEISKEMFKDWTALTTVTLNSSGSTIGESAFYGCTSLETVNNISSATSIGESAFYNCEKLSSVTLSSSLTSISKQAFYGCSSLTSIDLSNVTDIGESAFEDCTTLVSVTLNSSNDVTIEKSAFSGCSQITSLTLTKVTSIGETAFSGCSSLSSIDLSNVVTIGDNAFSECTALKTTTTLTLSSATEIGESVFANWTSLSSVTMNTTSDVTIGASAFSGCSALTTIDLSKVTSIGESAFANSGLTSVTNLSSVQSIGESAFSGCSSLSVSNKTLDLSSATSIGSDAFKDCTQLIANVDTLLLKSYNSTDLSMFSSLSLVSIDLSGLTASVGSGAFSTWGSTLEKLILSSATNVDEDAFKDCSSLTYLDLAKVTSINSSWFSACKSTLETLILSSVTQVSPEIFNTWTNEDAYNEAQKNGKSISKTFSSDWTSLTTLYISSATTLDDNALDSLISLKEVTVSSSLTKIGSMVFRNCYVLTTINDLNFSEVTEIGDEAFANCYVLWSEEDDTWYLDLSKVTGTNIGKNAFDGCKSLTAVKLSDDLTKIYNQTFENCEKLARVFTSATPTSGVIELPSKLIYILYQAFENCYALVGSLDLSRCTNIAEVARKAFHNCRAITSVNFPNVINESVTSSSDKENTIAYQLFQGCSSLESFTFYQKSATSNIVSIDHMAFASCAKLPTISIPSTVKRIDYQAFQYCEELDDITLPDVLEVIGYNAFEGCTTLSSITIPSTVNYWKEGTTTNTETLGNYAFAKCTSLKTVTFEDGLKSIGSYTFNGCTSLPSIRLPLSIDTLKTCAFYGCEALDTIYLLDRTEDFLNYHDTPRIDEYEGDITPGTDCFKGVNENCFLVVPEDCARFYVTKEDGTYVGYGAIDPTAQGWSDIPFLREDSVTIEILTTEGYATHYSPYTYTLNENFQYGVITGLDEDGNLKITWHATNDNVVPAGSAVVIKGEKGSSCTNPTDNTTYTIDSNVTGSSFETGYVYGNSESIMYGTVNPYYNYTGADLAKNGVTNVPVNNSGGTYDYYKLSYYTNEYGVKELGFYMQDEDGSPFEINGDTENHKYDSGVKLAWLAIDESTIPSGVRPYYKLPENVTGIDEIEMDGLNCSNPDGSQYGSGNDVIYNLQGMKVNNMNRKGIYIINGKKVVKR